MLSKYSVLALLGSANAAAGPLPTDAAEKVSGKAYPKFSDTATVPNDMLEQTGVKAAFIKIGGTGEEGGEIRGFRDDIYILPQQKLKQSTADKFAAVYNDGTASGSVEERMTIIAPDSGYTAFYGTDNTKRAKKASNTPATMADAAAFMTVLANNESWNVCKTLTTPAHCNGGMMVNKLTIASNVLAASVETSGSEKNVYRYITGRILTKINNTAVIDVAAGGATQKSSAMTFDNDVLMASFYQSSAAAPADAKVWCTAWSVPTKKDGKETKAEASEGWAKESKCTWQFVSDDKSFYPSVKLTNADQQDTFIQFQEWASVGDLGSNAALPAEADTTYQLGLYTVANGHVYLNPATALGVAGTKWAAWSDTTVRANNPVAYWPGSFGTLGFYPAEAGPSKETQVITVDSSIILDRFSFVSTVFNDYSAKKTTYDGLRTTYNDAAQKESDRLKDFFKAMFEPPVTVPTRPCAPTQPAAYSGVTIDLAANLKDGAASTAEKQGKLAVLQMRADTYTKEARFHARIGYLLSGADRTKTGAVTNVGHVWGRFGEGDKTLYTNTAPFFYGEVASAALPGLQISVFPGRAATTALASGKTITFAAMSKEAGSWDQYKVASRPGAAEEPSKVLLGAKALLATGFAAATVIATIA